MNSALNNIFTLYSGNVNAKLNLSRYNQKIFTITALVLSLKFSAHNCFYIITSVELGLLNVCQWFCGLHTLGGARSPLHVNRFTLRWKTTLRLASSAWCHLTYMYYWLVQPLRLDKVMFTLSIAIFKRKLSICWTLIRALHVYLCVHVYLIMVAQ